MPGFVRYILFPLAFLLSQGVYAQSCPPNVDFELGNLNNWNFFIGLCCLNTPTPTPPLPSRHALTSGSATDPYGGFPIVDPLTGSHSLKLGNDSVGAQAERASYYIHVPPNLAGNMIVLYRYAIVLQAPGHQPQDQPRFVVRAVDSATNNTLSCSEINYVASNNLPGFLLSTTPGGVTPVYYRPWSTSSLLIEPQYAGKTIAIEFITGDCAQGAHFGYAYVDVNCGYFETDHHIPCNTPSITLQGPPGYQDYKWMDAGFSVTYGNSANVTVPGPLNKTTYALILTPYNGFGCPDTLFSTYYVYGTLLDVQNDTTICSGDTVVLNSTVKGTITGSHWSPPTGLSCTNCLSPTASPTGTMKYVHLVTEPDGCQSIDSLLITVDTLALNVTADTTICAGGDVQLDVSSGNTHTPINYNWTPVAGLSCTNCNNPVATVTATTTYKVTAMNSIGCEVSDVVKVTTDDSATAEITLAKDSICVHEQVEIMNTGTKPGSALHGWGTDTGQIVSGGGTEKIKVWWNSESVKTITLTITNGTCVDTDTATIVVIAPPQISFEVAHDVCLDAPTLLYTQNPDIYYYWSIDEHEITDTSYKSPIELRWSTLGKKYISLKVSNRNGCISYFNDSVNIRPLPVAQIDSIDRISICKGEPATVYAQSGLYYTYEWGPAHYFNSNNSAQVTATILNSADIGLKVTDQWGCSDVDSDYVSTESCCEVFLPDAFTPNGDGRNDLYRIKYGGRQTIITFMIANRWGNIVYESTGANNGWDGSHKGTPQPPGTYFYFLKYKCDNEIIERKNSFILLR